MTSPSLYVVHLKGVRNSGETQVNIRCPSAVYLTKSGDYTQNLTSPVLGALRATRQLNYEIHAAAALFG